MFKRHRFGALGAFGAIIAVAALGAIEPASGQNWPTRAVSMVVPFGAGSASDTAGRVVGARMSELLGQQVIVENTPGAGGMTGSARVVNSPPDGYMFSFGSTDTIAINQTLYKKPLYNAATDFAPVTMVVDQPMILIVRSGLPVNTLKEFIAYTKENQSKMQFGSSGVGSSSHLGCTRVNLALGITPQHIPYRGSGQAMQDLAGGRIDYFCALGAAAVGPLGSKTAKAIALLGRERSPLFPDIPSSQEQGLSGVDTYFWSGFFYPKGTPDAIVQRLQKATSDALDTPAVAERLRKVGSMPVPPARRSSDYLKRFVVEEIAAWEKTIKAAGVSID
jgi:tripartite-type tricarboxylate transporter receptor subunit TctC